MPKKDLFTPDGYYSLRSIRAELLKLKNSQDEVIFNNEKDLDDILTQFWFKDRETAFIALEQVYPVFREYLVENKNNFKRLDFYSYFFETKFKSNIKSLTDISIQMEIECKNELSRSKITKIAGKSNIVALKLFSKIKITDKNQATCSFVHHTISEYLVANKIIQDSKNGRIDFFITNSTLTTPTKPPQRYFNQSWYGVAQFLLESNLFNETLDFFLEIGEENNEVVDQNFAENLSRINFPNKNDPRKNQLFSLIYQATKNSNRWISPWAKEGIANLYTKNQLITLLNDLHPEPTQLSDIVRTCNAISILGELVEKKIITNKTTLNDLKKRFIVYAKQPITTGVLQRESLSALSSFRDISIIPQIAPHFKNLNKNTKEKLIAEAFIRFCYDTAPNDHQSIDSSLNSIGDNQTKVYAWQGLKQITDPKSLLYLLEQISKNNSYLNSIIDGENIFLDTKEDRENPLLDNLTKLAKSHPKQLYSLSQKIIYSACSLNNYYAFHNNIFVSFLINTLLNINPQTAQILLDKAPKKLSKDAQSKLADTVAHIANEDNYLELYKKVKETPDNINSFINNIKNHEIYKKLAKLESWKIPKQYPETKRDTPYEIFHKKLYPDPSNHEVYMTDLFEYYLQSKSQIQGELSKEDQDHLWYLSFTKGLEVMDPAKFQLKISFGSNGNKSFNWSQQATFYGDMVRVVRDLEQKFDFSQYRSRLIQFIPFTYSDDLTTISKIIGTATEEELEPLNKIFLNKKSDRRYLNPESYIRFVKDLKERGSEIISPKEVLESFLEDPKIDDWVQISAIEALPLFASVTDTTLKRKLKKIGEGTNSKATSATSVLISHFGDRTAIRKRFCQIKELAVEKRIRGFGVVYELDDVESEYSDYHLPKPLIDSKDPKLANQFFDLLSDSLQYVTNPLYKNYCKYVNTIIYKYLELIASPKNFKLLDKLDKIVGKNSLYWNYQLPLLKVSFLTRKEVYEFNN